MADAEATQRIAAELQQIQTVIETLTGLKSNWSGTVILDDTLESLGTKPFNCDIILRVDVAYKPERWRTLIHETLHCFSAGYNPLDFVAHRGWEEGVVEKLQRHLRPTVLARLGVSAEETIFQATEASHAFNLYIEAVEEVRQILGGDVDAFYIGLLKTPIRDRYSALLQQAIRLDIARRKPALETLSKHKNTLDGRV